MTSISSKLIDKCGLFHTTQHVNPRPVPNLIWSAIFTVGSIVLLWDAVANGPNRCSSSEATQYGSLSIANCSQFITSFYCSSDEFNGKCVSDGFVAEEVDDDRRRRRASSRKLMDDDEDDDDDDDDDDDEVNPALCSGVGWKLELDDADECESFVESLTSDDMEFDYLHVASKGFGDGVRDALVVEEGEGVRVTMVGASSRWADADNKTDAQASHALVTAHVKARSALATCTGFYITKVEACPNLQTTLGSAMGIWGFAFSAFAVAFDAFNGVLSAHHKLQKRQQPAKTFAPEEFPAVAA